MSSTIIRDQQVFAGAYDITGVLTSLSLGLSAEALENTPLGHNTRVRIPGIEDASFDYDGNWDAGTGLIDTTEYADVAAAVRAVSVCVQAGADGEVAYAFQSLKSGYELGGGVGEVLKFTSSGLAGGSRPIRGTILHPATARTQTGNGTARQVGAILAGQVGYAALHVTAVSGTSPTLAVIVQSDDAGAFGDPTSRITFAQATGITSEWKTVAGAVTDDYWRVNYTIGGTGTPTFTFVVVFGIR